MVASNLEKEAVFILLDPNDEPIGIFPVLAGSQDLTDRLIKALSESSDYEVLNLTDTVINISYEPIHFSVCLDNPDSDYFLTRQYSLVECWMY